MAAIVSWIAPQTCRQKFLWATSQNTVLKYVTLYILTKKSYKTFLNQTDNVFVTSGKMHTGYFDIIGVVFYSWLDLNFLELSVQEEFWGFNFYLSKEQKIVWNLENDLRTILHLLCLY